MQFIIHKVSYYHIYNKRMLKIYLIIENKLKTVN